MANFKKILITLVVIALQLIFLFELARIVLPLVFTDEALHGIGPWWSVVLSLAGLLAGELIACLIVFFSLEKGTTRSACITLCAVPGLIIGMILLMAGVSLAGEYKTKNNEIIHAQQASTAALSEYQKIAASDLTATVVSVSTDGGNYSGYLKTDQGFYIDPPQLQTDASGVSGLTKMWQDKTYGADVYQKFGAFEAQTLPGQKIKIVLPAYQSATSPLVYNDAWIVSANFYLPNGELFSKVRF